MSTFLRGRWSGRKEDPHPSSKTSYGGFQKWGTPKWIIPAISGWELGVPQFQETTISSFNSMLIGQGMCYFFPMRQTNVGFWFSGCQLSYGQLASRSGEWQYWQGNPGRWVMMLTITKIIMMMIIIELNSYYDILWWLLYTVDVVVPTFFPWYTRTHIHTHTHLHLSRCCVPAQTGCCQAQHILFLHPWQSLSWNTWTAKTMKSHEMR